MNLDFRLRRGQFAGNNLAGKAHFSMGAIAERLVFRVPATAERNPGAPGEPKHAARGVADFELSFNADGAVILYGDFGGHADPE